MTFATYWRFSILVLHYSSILAGKIAALMFLKKLYFCLFILAIALSPNICHAGNPALILGSDTAKTLRLQRATAHVEKMISLKRKSNHLWKRSIWWTSANIMESLIDYHQLTGKDFSKELKKIYRRNVNAGRPRFISPNAFDDDEWWALAWLKAYDMTGDKKYLAISDGIFRHMVKQAWSPVCGGGLNWQLFHHYKNSVTNELFLILSARLALATQDSVKKKYYSDWAFKEWDWFRQSKMFSDTLWIADGLAKDCSCHYGTKPEGTYTYTQGLILGGLKYLYQLTSDRKYLDEARVMAHASMKNFSNSDGILTENGDIPSHDNIQFKGVYIRYLALINTELHDVDITKYILHNADHVWLCNRGNDGFCDYDWNGPYKKTRWSGAAHGSTMDLMNAALMQYSFK